jgi:hypothetical protein
MPRLRLIYRLPERLPRPVFAHPEKQTGCPRMLMHTGAGGGGAEGAPVPPCEPYEIIGPPYSNVTSARQFVLESPMVTSAAAKVASVFSAINMNFSLKCPLRRGDI